MLCNLLVKICQEEHSFFPAVIPFMFPIMMNIFLFIYIYIYIYIYKVQELLISLVMCNALFISLPLCLSIYHFNRRFFLYRCKCWFSLLFFCEAGRCERRNILFYRCRTCVASL